MNRYRLGDQLVETTVATGPGTVRVGDAEVVVEPQPDGSFRLVHGGRSVVAWLDGDTVTIHGASRRVSLAPPRAAEAPPVVTPPMPAVVSRVFVAVGDRVEARQGLVAVTAMKMEVVLRAPHAGTVTAVRAAPGDKVGPGDVLVDVLVDGLGRETP